MVGAIGSAASGLALAGPQMLKWIKATKFATIAQKAFNLVMRLNPIGLIITAIGLAGLAIYKWRDQIGAFMRGAWNKMIAGLEKGYNFIARLVPGMKEVSYAAKFSFEPAVEDATDTTEDFAAMLKEAERNTKSWIPPVKTLSDTMKDFDKTVEGATPTVIQWNFQLNKLVPVTHQVSDEMDWLTSRFNEVKAVPIGDFLEGLGVISDQTGLKIHDVTSETEHLTASTGLWSNSITDVGKVMINQFIPGPLRGLTGGINAAFSSIMGKGGKGGLMGAFSAFTGAIGPGGFIAFGVGLLIKHFGKVISGIKSIIGWIGKAIRGFLRLFGIGKKTQASLNQEVGAGRNRTGTSTSTSTRGRERHRGGPVTAGQAYSTIPGEVFVPSTNGTVVNPGLIDYDRLGAAVAAAMQRAPIVVPQDQVTGANYRNGPRWAALHGFGSA